MQDFETGVLLCLSSAPSTAGSSSLLRSPCVVVRQTLLRSLRAKAVLGTLQLHPNLQAVVLSTFLLPGKTNR